MIIAIQQLGPMPNAYKISIGPKFDFPYTIRLVTYGCYHETLLRYAAPPTSHCALPQQTLLKLGPMPNAYKISNRI